MLLLCTGYKIFTKQTCNGYYFSHRDKNSSDSGGATPEHARGNAMADINSPWQSEVVIKNYISRYFDCLC